MKKYIKYLLIFFLMPSCSTSEINDTLNGNKANAGELVVNGTYRFTGYDLVNGQAAFVQNHAWGYQIAGNNVTIRKTFAIIKAGQQLSEPYVAQLMDTYNPNYQQPFDTVQLTITTSNGRASGSFRGRIYSGSFNNIKYIP